MNKNSKGLTLIETLVAISVLMVAVSGALSLSNKSLQSTAFAKDQ
jgi:Tfp pilus assembly protein PilV